MITVRVPFRISFFGGSTDYKSFYENHGSLIIGTTINKYIYLSMRKVPMILLKNKESRISYSKIEIVTNTNDIQNPLIRETFRFKNVCDPMELVSFVDVPSRTGLGGSSAYCVGLLHLINRIYSKNDTKKVLAKEAIYVEREILKESGGIQDQILTAYGGFNTIEIKPNSKFYVKPLPITEDFKNEFQNSLVLIYTNEQRNQDDIPKSHENKDKTNILKIAKEGYTAFVNENIKSVGNLLYESWKEKKNLSSLISNNKVDEIIKDIMTMGAYGCKLLGSGGCGFILSVCNDTSKKHIIEKYKDNILDFIFENSGVCEIYRN